MTAQNSLDTTSSAPQELLAQFFDEASTAVGTLASETTRVANLFRHYDLKPANEALATLPPELRNFIVMVNVVGGQLGIDQAELTVDALTPAEQIGRLTGWIESLIEAQKNDDALTIADVLEYDLEPFFRSWEQILKNRAAR